MDQTEKTKTEQPPYLDLNWLPDNKGITELIEEINKIVDVIQTGCSHPAWEEIRKYDRTYCPRIDGKEQGLNVFLGQRCKKCKIFKPRKKGPPWTVCYKCGGDMEHSYKKYDNLFICACRECGHIYETYI